MEKKRTVCLLAALLTAAGGGALAAPAAPKLTVAPPRLDYGTCGHRERIEKKVTLTNAGPGTLQIGRLKSSCSCTKVKLSKYTLSAGETAELTSTLSTGRVMGVLHKYIELKTNDPQRPALKIPVIAKIHAGAKSEPWTLPSFEAVADGEPVTQSFTLKWRTPKRADLKLENLKASRSNVATRIEPLKAGTFTSGYRIQVTITPPSAEGLFSSTLTAKLNGKNWEFPVRGYVFSGIVVSPRYFQFGRIDDEENARSSIKLRTADGTPFQILDIVSSPDILDFELDGEGDGLEYVLTARIAVADRSKRFFARVKLMTSHPRKPEIDVTCLGFWPTKKPPKKPPKK